MSVLGSIDARLLGLGIVLLVTGSLLIAAWYLVRRRGVGRLLEAGKQELAELKARARREAEELEAAARREAESTRREARVEAKEQVLQARQDLEEDSRARRKELGDLEQRLTRREEKLERRTTTFEERERKLSSLEDELRRRERQVEAKEAAAARKKEEATRRLEEVAGQTAEEARESLVELIEKEAREQAAKTVRRVEQEAEVRAEREATRIIATAIQRCASDHVAENTVSVVELPSDDMKGRIIGREGRNIRAFEMITGVNLIVDDTPEAVLISTFDPLRREIARLALVRLVDDGRIHPARIEEVVEKVRDEIDEQVREEGLDAAAEVGIHDLDGELVRLLGMLKYRTSYGQNVLRHSLEVSTIAGILAAELGVNEQVARRAGLLHDIGKAIDHEVEGTHLQIGMDLLRRFGESEEVIQGMEAHHYDVEPATVEAVLVQAADALSAARPGARRDMLESYVKRLEKLEELADSFNGVTKAYAIQAGRELRIIVESGKVSDDEAVWLSKDIAKRIQREVQYPGEIKVTVIRETRAVEYAR